ncbi:MAG TPA: 4Fe-4S binding protein [Usitatibacter sp.]|nr:4Fe-4S binding protein [Usitatibacter sp.]
MLEKRGWTEATVECAPKLAALAALERLSPSEPIPSVSYLSRGNVLVVAGSDALRARSGAESLAATLPVTLVGSGDPPSPRVQAWPGRVSSLDGYLGEFTATLEGVQADARPAPAKFDLVLDFSDPPLFAMRQPPQGYFAAPPRDESLDEVIAEMREAVGEFEKPRYFAYRENICAHARSAITGCSACIDICSTQAIVSDGDHVKVDPHLCMGCGACSTVCPSGAMSYQFPRVADRGEQMRHLLEAYAQAGGRDASLVFHDGAEGRALLARSAAEGAGLPANALPLETWHVASVGLDLLLSAVALGASRVAVIATRSVDSEYRAALREQMALGEAILNGLGYAGRHFALVEEASVDALDAALGFGAPAIPAQPASFAVSNDKRTSIEFAVEHLAKHAPAPVDEIALPAGAPFGEIRVDSATCTMCMACVGSCPESALMDGVDTPLLKFLERNCVQCGLCEATCPEDAITLSPRLLLTPAVREARVINRTEPFLCVRCQKPFGTRQMVEAMLGRLSGHSMFTGEGALVRLRMCADCRVVDMMSSKGEVSVLNLGSKA